MKILIAAAVVLLPNFAGAQWYCDPYPVVCYQPCPPLVLRERCPDRRPAFRPRAAKPCPPCRKCKRSRESADEKATTQTAKKVVKVPLPATANPVPKKPKKTAKAETTVPVKDEETSAAATLGSIDSKMDKVLAESTSATAAVGRVERDMKWLKPVVIATACAMAATICLWILRGFIGLFTRRRATVVAT